MMMDRFVIKSVANENYRLFLWVCRVRADLHLFFVCFGFTAVVLGGVGVGMERVGSCVCVWLEGECEFVCGYGEVSA